MDGSTHMCEISQCGGGVGRNIAEALWRLRDGRVHLLTAVGNDADAKYLQDLTPGLLLEGCVIDGMRTATYAAVFDQKGDCLLGLGEMDVHSHISIALVNKHLDKIKMAPLVVFDGNIPQPTMNYVIELCCQLNKPMFFEPTDKRKATKALHGNYRFAYSSPNINELRAMARYLEHNHLIKPTNDLNEMKELYKIVSKFIRVLLLTTGEKGVVIMKESIETAQLLEPSITEYKPNVVSKIENVSGAGDSFASGFIHGLLEGLPESKCILIGFKCAEAALLSKSTVPTYFDI